MSADLYEVIELPSGEIALRRAGEEGEPLVRIKFSEESLQFLQDAKYEVAKAMIEAGMEAASELAMASIDSETSEIERSATKVLH